MEIKKVFLKTRAEFGKQCIFDTYGPHIDEKIKPNPEEMVNYYVRSYCDLGVQNTKQFALHEIQTITTETKNSGMFHFEGGWPKEINPKDEETTLRFRRRVEKSEEWAPKLRKLFERMESGILQNGAINIYQNYFDDMIPTKLLKPRNIRTVNVYEDPLGTMKPVTDISWSPDQESNKIVVSYCFLDLEIQNDSTFVYIWHIENPNKPWMKLIAPCATMVTQYNPRDPSVLASGLMSGQICSWDIRTGDTPVQISHRQFSHRDFTTVLKWITTKSNTEFFTGSSDGRAMWWDTRQLRAPTDILMFDLEVPNEPQMDRAIGVSSANFEPSVSAKFMFGLENGVVISGSKKAKTPAEKLATRFYAHHAPVCAVDRNSFNPKIFLSIGDCTARIWAEDTRDYNLVSTRFIKEGTSSGCWNKVRNSVYYLCTNTGMLMVWDLLLNLHFPILTMQLCEEKLSTIAAHEAGALLAVGNTAGNVYLIDSTEALYSFERPDKTEFAAYLERCSRFVKAVDTRLKEIKLVRPAEPVEDPAVLEVRKRRPSFRERRRSLVKERRDRGREKPKKKIKDEFPELIEIEDDFFEMVRREKEKHEDELNDEPSKIRSLKKLVSQKLIDRPDEEMKFDIPPLFKIPRKLPILEPEKDDEEEDEDLLEEEPLPPEVEVEVEVAVPVKKIKRKRRKRKKRRRFILKLPRPCKRGICKPRICCRLPVHKPSISAMEQAAEDRAVLEDIREQIPIRRKDKERTKMKSWTTLLRAYMHEKPITKCEKKQKLSSLRATMALHEKFTEDVKAAESGLKKGHLSEMPRPRKLGRKIMKKSLVKPLLERDRDREKEAKRRIKRIIMSRKSRKVRRVHEVDPCTPWKPPSLKTDMDTILRGLPLERVPSEEKERVTTYSKKIEALRSDYPRISDFHSIE